MFEWKLILKMKTVLKSFTLAERTIVDLGIQISYFKHGSVQTVNQYK